MWRPPRRSLAPVGVTEVAGWCRPEAPSWRGPVMNDPASPSSPDPRPPEPAPASDAGAALPAAAPVRRTRRRWLLYGGGLLTAVAVALAARSGLRWHEQRAVP